MRKGEARREQILEHARDVFAERGFHAATVEDIVARVEVARGTFYLYFADKRAVFEALVDRLFERLEQAVRRIDLADPRESALDQLRGNLLRVIELALTDPATMKVLFLDAASLDPAFNQKLDSFYRALRELFVLALADGQEMGLVRDGDRQVMAALGLGMIKEALLEAVTGGLDRSAAAIADEMMAIVRHGYLARAEAAP